MTICTYFVIFIFIVQFDTSLCMRMNRGFTVSILAVGCYQNFTLFLSYFCTTYKTTFHIVERFFLLAFLQNMSKKWYFCVTPGGIVRPQGLLWHVSHIFESLAPCQNSFTISWAIFFRRILSPFAGLVHVSLFYFELSCTVWRLILRHTLWV